MIGQEIVYSTLEKLDIPFEYYQSPDDFSDEDDIRFWEKINATRCKNLSTYIQSYSKILKSYNKYLYYLVSIIYFNFERLKYHKL